MENPVSHGIILYEFPEAPVVKVGKNPRAAKLKWLGSN